MQLIKKIEISYLRSLYTANLMDVGDLNLIFGRNDSGKSNILRALNLFFNDETDVDVDPFFDVDFSDIRRFEAKQRATRQFFSIKITFNVPLNYRKSLGETVFVKRQWNRYDEMNESVARGTTKGTRIQLTKFLSSIDYTYVPAIKDREVFQRLIQRMYDATAEGSGLQRSTRDFVTSIQSETTDLSKSLTTSLGTIAKLAAPTDMGLLFRSLDFSHGEDEHSLLLQKGDGVKARHIPELLRYINETENGTKLYIWGFEEPENSLDLAAAAKESGNFAKISERSDTQVFITSHSPAFYLAEAKSKDKITTRYFVSKQIVEEKSEVVQPKNAVDIIFDLDDAEEKMQGASLLELPYVIRSLDTLKKENETLSKTKLDLQKELDESQKTLLFVEGKHDKKLFDKYFDDDRVAIKALGGTPNNTAELVKSVIIQGGAISKNPSLFLFDNDGAGRQAYKNLTKLKEIDEDPIKVAGQLHCWVLPVSDEFDEFCEEFEIAKSVLFYPAEFLFPGNDAASCYLEILTDEEIDMSATMIYEPYHQRLPQKISAKLRECQPGSKEWFWTRGVSDDHKERFAKRALKSCSLENVEEIVEKIKLVV